MGATVHIPFDNTYRQIADELFSEQAPTAVKQPSLIQLNRALAEFLSIDSDSLASEEGVAILSGNSIAEGSQPIATVYAGHQFGSWNPQLGDGRAILLGEVIGKDGERYDLQLKGAGRTPYSRGGDGRSPLGPVIREYILTEAMAALGVPTTRSLAAVSSGDHVMREDILSGGILTRVARSHIRIGTFQFFAARQDWGTVKKLADHVIARHYPSLEAAADPYLQLLAAVIEKQAELVAHWQSIGFIHGVMNTDNMLVSGETVDYGPCAFMDEFHPGRVYSSIDQHGRYAYGNQPSIAHWNLAWLAQSLLPLIHEDEDRAVAMVQVTLDDYPPAFEQVYRQRMCAKIGLPKASDEDFALLNELLELMADHSLDFTLTFAGLADYLQIEELASGSVAALVALPEAFKDWVQRWRGSLVAGQLAGDQWNHDKVELVQQQLRSVNPLYIPRNHLVEEAILAAYVDDLQPFQRLIKRLEQPFDYADVEVDLAIPPRPEQVVPRTFCGT